MRIGIIGLGKIGREVGRQAYDEGWEVVATANSKRVYVAGRELPYTLQLLAESFSGAGIKVVFLCIPSNQPETAKEYLVGLTSRGVPVVTAEKAGIARYWPETVGEYPFCINYDVAVGGGSGILAFMREHARAGRGRFREMHAIVNGTINFVLWCMDELGSDLSSALETAAREGLTEPNGARDALGVLNGEMDDVAQKMTIILNDCGIRGEKPVRIGEVVPKPITATDMENRSRHDRLVFSIVRAPRAIHSQFFVKEFGDFVVSLGFHGVQNPLYHRLAVPSKENAAVVYYENEPLPYFAGGPGAGPRETARAMIRGAERLVRG